MLDDILIKYFGSGFENPEDTDCESYEKLIKLLYDVGTLVERDVNYIVDILDSIAHVKE